MFQTLMGLSTVASINVAHNEKKRLRLSKNALEENLVQDKLEYKKITLSAGDGIIFDTNCPHYASPVKKWGTKNFKA